MNLSMKSKYGILCMIDLAIHNRKCSIKELSKRQKISTKYTEAIFSQLKKNNLVISQRGIHGGYTLALSPKEITLFHIINVLETNESISAKTRKTDPLKRIIRSSVWHQVDQSLNGYLKNISIYDVIKKYQIEKPDEESQ